MYMLKSRRLGVRCEREDKIFQEKNDGGLKRSSYFLLGSMNAVEHAMQAGISTVSGCISAAAAAGARTGRIIDAVAVLEAISVKNVTTKQRTIRKGIRLRFCYVRKKK